MQQARPYPPLFGPDTMAMARKALQAYGGRGALFLTNFFISKVIGYLGPLVLAAVLTSESYGALEFALSLATLIANFMVFGVANALPQLVLLRNPAPVKDILSLLTGLAGVVTLVIAGICTFVLQNEVAGLACLITVMTTIQYSASAYAKTHSLRNVATWVDNLSLVSSVILGCALAALGFGHTPGLGALLIAFSLLATGFVAASFWIAHQEWKENAWPRLMRAMKLGAPLIIMTIASAWVAAAAGRTLVGFTLPLTDVALFALCFRIASLALIVHYVISTAFYAPFYSMPARAFEHIIPYYIAGVGMLSGAFAIGAPLLLPYLPSNAVHPDNLGIGVHILPVLSLNTFAITVQAALESRVARARRVTRGTFNAILVSIPVAAAFFALAYFDMLTLQIAVWLIAAQTIGVNLRFFAILGRRGMHMPRVFTVVCFCYACLAIIALIESI